MAGWKPRNRLPEQWAVFTTKSMGLDNLKSHQHNRIRTKKSGQIRGTASSNGI
jgi:hypothetical protein